MGCNVCKISCILIFKAVSCENLPTEYDMFIRMYLCIYLCMKTCTCLFFAWHLYSYVLMHVYMHVHLLCMTCVFVCIYLCMYTCSIHARAFAFHDMRIGMYVLMHAYMHVCMAFVFVCIYWYICIHVPLLCKTRASDAMLRQCITHSQHEESLAVARMRHSRSPQNVVTESFCHMKTRYT